MKTMKAKLTLFIALFALISVFAPNVKAEAATQKPATPSGLGIYSSVGNKNQFALSWNWDSNMYYYSDTSYLGDFGYEVKITTLKNKTITEQDFYVYSTPTSILNVIDNKVCAVITNSKLKKQGFKFKVRAYVYDPTTQGKVWSDWSAEKVIIPRATITKASLVKGNGNKVNIKFSKVSGAKSYTIYLSSNNGKSFKKVGTTTKTNYTISKKFTRGKEYVVYVSADKVKYKKKNYSSTKPTDKLANCHGFTVTTVYR